MHVDADPGADKFMPRAHFGPPPSVRIDPE
jgi:hypothetical protein